MFTSPVLGRAPYQTASFSEDFRRGEITLRQRSFAGRPTIYPLHYPLDEVFMVHLLARGHGVEVHGGGVVMPDGRGWLFVGVSGAGKTTLSRMWCAEPDVRVLSDERIILREEDGEIWMYGTPWHGDGHIAEPGRARLDRVFFLRHGPHNALTAVPSASDRRAPLRLRLHPVPRRGRPRLQPWLPGRGRAARALRRAGVRSRPQRSRVRARLVAPLPHF